MSVEVDARNQLCPQPVIMTKKALAGLSQGSLIVKVNNPISEQNVLKFARSQGCKAVSKKEQDDFIITIEKGNSNEISSAIKKEPVDEASSPATGLVYFVTKNTLGSGSDELGKILMNSFFVALRESELPVAMLFINSGVHLTVQDSPVLEHVEALAEAGVTILSCGTCLDYYHLKEKLAVGSVTNMYTILETMQQAPKVITL